MLLTLCLKNVDSYVTQRILTDDRISKKYLLSPDVEIRLNFLLQETWKKNLTEKLAHLNKILFISSTTFGI